MTSIVYLLEIKYYILHIFGQNLPLDVTNFSPTIKMDVEEDYCSKEIINGGVAGTAFKDNLKKNKFNPFRLLAEM